MPEQRLRVPVASYLLPCPCLEAKPLLEDFPSKLRPRFFCCFEHLAYPWAARFVMGMPVPTWTRGLEWNIGLKSRFISAVWSGADLGSYLTNNWCEPVTAGRALVENSEILIDGQQRLNSLEEYFPDRLAIPDVQGQPRIWSELGNGERKRFLSTIFTHARVSSAHEVALRETYDLCAQGVVLRSSDLRAFR